MSQVSLSDSPSLLQLSISGPDASQRLQKGIREGQVVRIGRAPKQGWAVPWDRAISREHADIRWQNGQLNIEMVPTATNPIIYRNKMMKELTILPGDWFQIGETKFQAGGVAERTIVAKPGEKPEEDTVNVEFDQGVGSVMEEYAYSQDELNKVAFRNSELQLEILSRLPRLISGSHTDEDLGALLSRLLLDAVPPAEAIAVAHFDETRLPESEADIDSFPKPLTLRVETRENYSGRFSPSRKILLRALKSQTSVIHIWDADDESGGATVSAGLGWAFCSPIVGESSKGWCLYVAGKGTTDGGLIVTEEDVAGDLRFTELVAQFIGSIRNVRLLQEQKTQLSSFFSPKVIEGLTNGDGRDTLVPSEKNISVLFCDVRGFSKKSEKLQDDLLTLLRSVSAALNVMAKGILQRDGAIADFQGDAALGFWGWPAELEEGPVPACKAAIAICNHFHNEIAVPGSLLEGFSVGLGVAHGRALAGQIGTDQQAKVGVFGPVVNQGARLETMTKQFDVPICMDEPTAEYAKKYLPESDGRIRRLARVRPKGMDTPMTVFSLLPPTDQFAWLTDEVVAVYDEALDAVIQGDWSTATEILKRVPDKDGPKQFLIRNMAALGNAPPASWDGAFSLANK
jgi:adenylate cyclase